MEREFKLSYVVVKNDGVNEYEAEAGFNNITEAVLYADKRASEHEAFNPSDSEEVYASAKVALYEVVSCHGGKWYTIHETSSFYND